VVSCGDFTENNGSTTLPSVQTSQKQVAMNVTAKAIDVVWGAAGGWTRMFRFWRYAQLPDIRVSVVHCFNT
jgi:hypothetical protein